MAALPAIRESSRGWQNRVRLPRDHHVRTGTCDYSPDLAVTGADGRCPRGPGPGDGDVRRPAGGPLRPVLGRAPDRDDPAHQAAADVMRAERAPARPAAPPAAAEAGRSDL